MQGSAATIGTPGSAAELEALGVVVILDPALLVVHISAHCGVLLGVGRERLVGAPLSDIIEPGDAEAVREALTSGLEAVGWRRIGLVSGGAMKLHAFDAGGGLVGIDLLPLPAESSTPDAQAVERVAAWSERITACGSSAELFAATAAVVRDRLEFNGVWVSRKEADGHSVLLAADVVDAPPTVGQSVQPGDALPDQPRVRGRPVPFFVADLAAEATHLSPPAPGSIDLSGSLLLRPYPRFLDRMMTLGARSIASIPIVVHGEMWGRVIAFHPSARRVPAATQAELGLLGVGVGARLDELLRLEQADERAALSRRFHRVVQSIAASDDLLDGLARDDGALVGVCVADAVVASIGGRTATVGAIDDEVAGQLLEVARGALRCPDADALVSSTTLEGGPRVPPQVAAGYLAVRLDHQADDVVVWIRGEERRTVTWVAPEVVGTDERDELFAGNGEVVELERGACAPWSTAQQQQAAELRESIGEVLIARYAKVKSLNAELTRSNEEYDAFAHAAAHDLKTPLRGISLNADFLFEDAQDRLTEAELDQLRTIRRLSGQMNLLLDDLLAYAQVGKSDWAPREFPLQLAVGEAVEMLGPRVGRATVTGREVSLTADPAALRHLLMNLIGNAAKYSEGPATVRVDVTTLAEAATRAATPAALVDASPQTQVLTVSDQGIGIDPEHHERIFGLFRQLDPAAEGSGTGLALCRLICRRHGGDIWLESAPGAGTTFFVVMGTE